MDLNDPATNLKAFMKARASLEPVDVVTWFTGNVHAWMPKGQFGHLFGFEGFNIAKAVETEGGYNLLTREAVFYRDPKSHEVLEKWDNPYTGETVDAVHVWNDPVNLPMLVDGPRGPFNAPVTGAGDDLYFNVDVFLAYPSPLPRADYPEHSQDDLYQAAELFQFFCSRSEIENPSVKSAGCQVSWTRLAPWLPWMKMADRAGQLVYHCRGKKLDDFEDLPEWVKAKVESEHPEYKQAPTEFTQPNETSWTYFKKILDA